MTAYFDALSMRLHDARCAGDHVALEQIECEVVRDVSQLAESPGFPADLRDEIHHVVLAHAVTRQPLYPNLRTRDNPRLVGAIEDPEVAVFNEIGSLLWEMHTVFHRVAARDGYSDNPRQYVDGLATRGEEYRERLAAEEVNRVR